MAYSIDKGMPMPPLKRSRLYPFADMQPGDSFKVPREQDHRLRSAANYYARKHRMNSLSRKQRMEFAVGACIEPSNFH